VELLRRNSSRPVHSVTAALALADATAETASARRRRRALDAVRSARQQIHQYRATPMADPDAKANYSTARLDLLEERLATAEARLVPKDSQ